MMPEVVRVLCVDDEPDLLGITRRFLEKDGEFEVSTAISAQEALASHEIPSYAAIVSDYLMPGMDGIAFLKAVRERFGDIPFILFTGRSREDVVIDAINNGADFYIQKGGDPRAQFAELAHKVRQAVRRRTAERDRIRSEEKFSKVFIANPSLEAITDLTTGKLVDVNEAWIRTTGYNRDDVIGKSTQEINLFPDCTDGERMAQEVFRKGIIKNFGTRIRTKSGDIRVLDFTGQRITVGDSHVLFSQAVDVTDRKLAEDAIREGREKLRIILENLPDLVVVHRDGLILYVNPVMAKAMGTTPDNLLGRSILDFIAPESHAAVAAAMIKRKEPGWDEPYEIGLQTRQPGHRSVHVRGSIIDFEGSPAVLNVLFDVTEQKRAEAALRESEERFRGMAERSSDLILIIDSMMGVTYASPSSRAILGYAPEELLGKTRGFAAATIFSPPLPEFNATVSAAMEGAPVEHTEMQIVKKDGETAWVDMHAVPVLHDGVFSGAQITLRDITARKKAEIALRESENKFATVFRSSPVALTLVSAEDAAFTDVNDAFLTSTGFSRDEVIGKTAEELGIFFDNDEYERVASALRKHYAIHGMEVKCRKKSGELRICRFTSSIIMMGERSQILSSVEDITERKASDVALRAMVQSMVGTTGLDALRKIAENVSSWLSADCVMIGEIQPDRQTVNVHSMLLDGKEVSGYSYTLRGTPCENVAAKGFCLCPDDAIRLFPESKDLAELDIRGYVGTPLRDSRGDVIGILCVMSRNPIQPVLSLREIMDIIAVKAAAEIERTHMEQTLREGEEKFRSIVETSPDLIWEIDLQGVFRYMSPMVTRILGYTPEETIGRSIIDLVAEEERSASLRKMAQMISPEGSISSVEASARHRDGHEVILEIRPSLTMTEGRLKGLRGVAVDITERKRAEEALRKSRHQLSEAMDIASLVNWEYDAATNMFTFDDRFYALYGTNAEREGSMQMSPQAYAREFVHPDDRHIVFQEVKEALKTTDPGYIMQVEHRIIRRDGATRHIVVRIGVILDAEGRVIKTHGANQDITDRKQAEKALSRANRQLSLLGSVTRHDILNKVSIILGFLRLAEMQFPDPALAELLKKIEANTDVIRTQVEFTRVYQELGTHEPQWIELDTVLPRSQVPATMSLHADVTGISLYADPMFGKVFFNLLDNSIRHGERVTEIRISSRQEGGNLIVAWEDNGVGIAPDEKEKIFERGFGKNTGLGMFLVTEILALTELTITEDGEPGKGARFEIRAPGGMWRKRNE